MVQVHLSLTTDESGVPLILFSSVLYDLFGWRRKRIHSNSRLKSLTQLEFSKIWFMQTILNTASFTRGEMPYVSSCRVYEPRKFCDVTILTTSFSLSFLMVPPFSVFFHSYWIVPQVWAFLGEWNARKMRIYHKKSSHVQDLQSTKRRSYWVRPRGDFSSVW